jgi:hypothetical protein
MVLGNVNIIPTDIEDIITINIKDTKNIKHINITNTTKDINIITKNIKHISTNTTKDTDIIGDIH